MSQLMTALFRMFIMSVILLVVSNGTSSTISQTPKSDIAFQVWTEGKGTNTPGWSVEVTVAYGDDSGPGGTFVPFGKSPPATVPAAVSLVPPAYNFDSTLNKWPGTKGKKMFVSSIESETQMGKKVLVAAASIEPIIP